MTGTARRLQWLLPDPAREVYMTARVPSFVHGEGFECLRCGAPVREGDVTFAVRDRGTTYRHRVIFYVHRRCVPTRDFQTAGLPARKVRRG